MNGDTQMFLFLGIMLVMFGLTVLIASR